MGMKSIGLSMLVFLGSVSAVEAATLNCASHRNAPAYINSSGQWRLEAKVQSPYTIKDVKLKNMRKSNLGSTSAVVRYDRRITDARLFELRPDVYCNYELVMPRNFKTQAAFQADLIMTCDDMYDGKATLNCSIR